MWLPWLVAVILGLVAANALLYWLPTSPFRDLFLGNLLATVLGVVVGIPVALELTRRQQLGEAKAESEAREATAAARRIRFLKMIQFSLLTNVSFLENVAKNLKPGAAVYPNVDMEQLEATASIKYEIIDDLGLAGRLDHVRFHLRFITRLLDLSLEFLYSQSRFDLEPDEFLVEHGRIVDRIQEQIPRATEVITDAANAIADALAKENTDVGGAEGSTPAE